MDMDLPDSSVRARDDCSLELPKTFQIDRVPPGNENRHTTFQLSKTPVRCCVGVKQGPPLSTLLINAVKLTSSSAAAVAPYNLAGLWQKAPPIALPAPLANVHNVRYLITGFHPTFEPFFSACSSSVQFLVDVAALQQRGRGGSLDSGAGAVGKLSAAAAAAAPAVRPLADFAFIRSAPKRRVSAGRTGMLVNTPSAPTGPMGSCCVEELRRLNWKTNVVEAQAPPGHTSRIDGGDADGSREGIERRCRYRCCRNWKICVMNAVSRTTITSTFQRAMFRVSSVSRPMLGLGDMERRGDDMLGLGVQSKQVKQELMISTTFSVGFDGRRLLIGVAQDLPDRPRSTWQRESLRTPHFNSPRPQCDVASA
ncbi:hypothetical protein VOLCADRAFT_90560 [Volvox carteri f. nagariensis]|uniref:Uncharacterized protein n=1 Tax=Volvox carteri f. nagariensis TaxID=3068 RepID=D8TUQ7_VOLCA|nr:uncharacterized protein VOLCADRAFT_90560 [Volvox carteri f. nagariensis]EFJ48749.1 hypothetical protein VOLCADRAFT_90560 [Volvox carteri f. nagariensis]|eukprot:XP_002950081.1 hypothetical protein VOLCADRAFT_90560 [Volvox carteri f. nagariensis]